jgi:PAS domain S-box-containing protein
MHEKSAPSDSDENRTRESLLQELADIRSREQQVRAALKNQFISDSEISPWDNEVQSRLIIDSLPVLIAYLDSDMHFRMINKTGAEWYGRPESEIIGMRLDHVFGPQQIGWRDQMKTAMRDGGGKYERRITYPDEVTRDVRVMYAPHADADADINGLFLLIEDISERKIVQNALQESEERLRNFFDLPLVGSAIYAVLDKTWIALNDAFCEMLGYRRDELLTLDWLDITHPDDRARNIALYESSVSSDGSDTYTMDKRFIGKDGKIIYATIFAQTIRNADGDPAYNLLSVRDTTLQVQAEKDQRERDNLLRSIIDNAPSPISLKDLDGRYLLVNDAFARMRGLTPDEMIGTTTYDNAIKQHADAATAQHKKIVESQKTVSEERDTKLPDGSPYQEFITKFPIFGDNGKIISVGSVSTDISELKEAEVNLRNSESRFRDFAESASDSFWEMDKNLRFVRESSTNDGTFSGFNNILGKTRWETADANPDKDPYWAAHKRQLEARRPFRNFEFWIPNSTGDRRCVSVSGVPRFDPDGEFIGYRGVAMDVTTLKKAEETVRAALEDARNANKAKRDFLANMSHELRTPLNAIVGFSEVLQSEYFGPMKNARYLDYANDISQSAKHLLSLVNDILDLSKIEAGKLELSFADIDLAAIASVAMRELQGQMRGKSQHFLLDIDRSAAEIRADETAVRQMMTNLLSNAIKFTPEHGEISLSVTSAGVNFVKISISDTGIGIPSADIEKIMSPFGQSGDIELAREGGTGLGLAIVDALVNLHNGSLEIDSAVGTGTQVHITLPRVPAQLDLIQDV